MVETSCQIDKPIELSIKRTEPSHIDTKTPPEWLLRAACGVFKLPEAFWQGKFTGS